MGRLEDEDGEGTTLLARTLVGRSPASDWVIADPSVSGEHAVVAWDGARWTVRDLSSRNGTRHNGVAVPAGEAVPLARGDTLHWGRQDDPYVLVDDAPPAGAPLPETLIHSKSMGNAELRFEVSADEEHAAWSVVLGSTEHPLGDRAHTYLLLTLARARLDEEDVPEDARGWRVADELARGLGITPEVLKVYVYRARKQLEEVGITDAHALVERRATSNQIRLGTDQVVIRRV